MCIFCKKSPKNRITNIFEELKEKGLIDPSRKLKSRDKNAYEYAAFCKIIYYNPKLLEYNHFDDNSIRFCLLHEEGHIQKENFGYLLEHLLLLSGWIIFVVAIIWSLSVCSGLIKDANFNIPLFLLFVGVSLFLIIFKRRIASKPLEVDEYNSDIFASEKIRDSFGIDKPSEIVSMSLNELEKFHEVNKKQDTNSYLYKLCISLTEYHPINSLRVINIIHQVDKK